jgi:hypothetical protein
MIDSSEWKRVGGYQFYIIVKGGFLREPLVPLTPQRDPVIVYITRSRSIICI